MSPSTERADVEGGLSRRELITGPAAFGPTCPGSGQAIPNVVVLTHESRRALFYDDLLHGKIVLLHFFSLAGERDYPTLATLVRVQELLGDRLGREIFLYSITVDPERDTARALAAAAKRLGAREGWTFLTGEPAAMATLKGRLFQAQGGHAHASHDPGNDSSDGAEDCSRGLLRYGNATLGLWGAVPARAEPAWIVERLAWLRPTERPTGPPRRRGPTAATRLASLALGALGGLVASLLTPSAGRAQHPHPQPTLAPSQQTTAGDTTTVVTGESVFPPSQPFIDPPGTNLLPNVYTNNFDSNGDEIPNTLPSTPTVPYNLHDGPPVVTTINRTSPTNDIASALDRIGEVARNPRRTEFDAHGAEVAIRRMIDILEGNAIPNRAYSGFPLLHYTGPLKAKRVEPMLDSSGAVVGGNVEIHQIWYDNHIESDTAMIDPTAVQQVPWTITYTVDVLDRGKDDFSPFSMYFDAPPEPFKPGTFGPLLVGMDQTFFPIDDGTRTVFRIKMPPAKYFSLSYTWGWRWHPPRVQVTENQLKVVGGKNLLEWEQSVFGLNPRGSEQARLEAIGKIGDLAPAKVMWRAMREALERAARADWKGVSRMVEEARLGFEDWKDRTRLPRGVPLDPDADLTAVYLNNTIYAQFTDGGTINFPRWQTRGTRLKVSLRNGDYFDHAYMNVDFGGGRGWENQFKSSVKIAGSGCWFTFGRSYLNENLSSPVTVPAARREPYRPDLLGLHKVHLTFNFDPSRRLRFYQFDPTHHDIAVFSVH